jgi:hypothetical protein
MTLREKLDEILHGPSAAKHVLHNAYVHAELDYEAAFAVHIKESGNYIVIQSEGDDQRGDHCDEWLPWWDSILDNYKNDARFVFWWDDGQSTFWPVNDAAAQRALENDPELSPSNPYV